MLLLSWTGGREATPQASLEVLGGHVRVARVSRGIVGIIWGKFFPTRKFRSRTRNFPIPEFSTIRDSALGHIVVGSLRSLGWRGGREATPQASLEVVPGPGHVAGVSRDIVGMIWGEVVSSQNFRSRTRISDFVSFKDFREGPRHRGCCMGEVRFFLVVNVRGTRKAKRGACTHSQAAPLHT